MKSPFVRDLEPNKVTVGTFLVQAKEIRQKKTGEPYLSLLLSDRSGEVDAKMWDNVGEVMYTFERDDFVKVKGLLQVYNNRPQFTIHKMQRVEESAVDLADFLPASHQDPAEMLAELRGIVAGMENPHLRGLVEAFLADPEVVPRLLKAPAAKYIHHAYLGGLLEHVLSLCHLCRAAAAHYRNVDGDLLLAGAVLHDIGKIYELNYARSFGYTSEGQLLGHIVIGVRMVEEKLAGFPDFPPKLRALLEHLVLSHHGSLEFGSPKVPLFPEALLLHYLDDLDAKMECMRALVDQDRQVEGHWTGYSNQLERVVLKKLKYLAEGVREPAEGPVPNGPCAAEAEAAPTADAAIPPKAAPPQPARPAAAEAAPKPDGAAPPAPAPPQPARPAAAEAAAPLPNPAPSPPAAPSPFGEKLGHAWQNLRDDKP